MSLENKKIAFAITDSYKVLDKVIPSYEKILSTKANVSTILADSFLSRDFNFKNTNNIVNNIRKITKNSIVNSMLSLEPIRENNMLDLLIIAPCSGDILAKIVKGIYDDTIAKAAQVQLINNKPILLAVAIEDKIDIDVKNIGVLLNSKNIFFVPFCQDNPSEKINSFIARFDLINEAAEYALDNKQIQPVVLEYSGL